MPATVEDIEQESTAILTAAERTSVRQVLRIESTVALLDDLAVTTALNAADAGDSSVLQAIRAELHQYKAGQIRLDGGQDALTYDVMLERWGVRNAIRLLLHFDPEPRPSTADSLGAISIELGKFAVCDWTEFSQ